MTRILLVEDDVDLRLIMEHVLIDGGYEVDTTATVEGGCELLDCRFYDIIVADGRLSDGTGMEIADRARENGLKTLIVTGYAFSMASGSLDGYEVLLKPVRPTELLEAITRAL
jgi:two-component system response regulator HydG